MNSIAIRYRDKLEVTDCCVCGVVFAVPNSLITQCRNHKQSLYCPNGHCLSWKESEEDRLRAQMARVNKQNIRLTTQLTADLKDAQNKLRAQKANNTKLKKRISAGICPCCNRTFKQLSAHMKNKHPEYVKERGNE